MTDQKQDGEKLLLTGSGLLAFLSQIEELKDQNLELIELEDSINVSIGDTTYALECSPRNEINVDEEVLEVIEDIDEDGYDDFAEEIEEEEIEGGIIKELIKTLAVGGLVRMTKNAIMKS